AVRTALDQSKRLVLEIADLSDEVLAGAMADAATLYLYNDGQSLKGVLSEPDFQKVRTIINDAGMPKDMAHLIRPWFVSTLLSVSPCERRRMAAGKSVLDKRLGEEAKARDLPVTGLETVAEQLNALASIPENEQVEMLKVSLLYADRTDDMIETLLQLYTQRRMGAAMPFQKVLARKAGAPPTIFDGFQRILLVDRNARMAKAADALLAEGGVFMAVGALHLPGSTGLVDLLRAQGYTLTAIE
ncbi:MAG: TraB/GumN family protein, partial [Hyphomicrobium sp.]